MARVLLLLSVLGFMPLAALPALSIATDGSAKQVPIGCNWPFLAAE